MSQPVCPVHGTAKLVPGGVSKSTGAPYRPFWSCEMRSCTAGKNGRGWSAPFVDEAKAPAAAPAPPAAASAGEASPRLTAAMAALQAACTRYSGTPTPTNMVLEEARIYLSEFLEPAFKGSLPTTFLQREPGEDDDIPNFR